MSKQISLTRGKVTIVDDSDYEWLNQWKWCAIPHRTTFYAFRLESERVGGKSVLMHAQIKNTPKGMETDHIDGDGLNNQRENLRIATTSQNQQNRGKQSNNTSGFKGVSVDRRGKNRANIMKNGKTVRLGVYATPELAARAYDTAAKELFGEFAYLNFPEK